MKKLLLTALCCLMALAASSRAGDNSFKGKEMTVYIRMMEQQDKWFRENIVADFERMHGVRINVRVFDNYSDLPGILDMDKSRNTIGVVKTPQVEVRNLVTGGYLMPMADVSPAWEQDKKEYLTDMIAVGTIDGKEYYIPRKANAYTLVYLKSRVKEAVENWTKYESAINEELKKHNGYGLPEGYTLEADPNQWDTFDLAVVGYYWANTEYNRRTFPRFAHRGRKYDGTVLEMMARTAMAGGNEADFTSMDSQPVFDMMHWEVALKEMGVYNPTMWEEGWTGGGIWNAMASGQVFLSTMSQMDQFFIHGGSSPEMQGYLRNPDDMGVAIMPLGSSLELKDGKPARTGIHGSCFEGWYWGIPASAPDKDMAYEFIRFVTNAENNAKECSLFGMSPIRNDIAGNLTESFHEDWMREVFENYNKQAQAGGFWIPTTAAMGTIQNLYLEAWYDIVIGGNNADVAKTLKEKFAPAATEALNAAK